MNKKRIVSIVVLMIGLITFVIGAVFLLLRLTEKPAISDGEYLMSVKNWVLEEDNNCGLIEQANSEEKANCEDGARVVWQFIDVGKGVLTTNNHLNDYSFNWILQEKRMLVQTDWLYKLNNEYEYTLNQNEGILILSDNDNEYRFVAQPE